MNRVADKKPDDRKARAVAFLASYPAKPNARPYGT